MQAKTTTQNWTLIRTLETRHEDGTTYSEHTYTLSRRDDDLYRLRDEHNTNSIHSHDWDIKLYTWSVEVAAEVGRLMRIMDGDEDAIGTMTNPEYTCMVGPDDLYAAIYGKQGSPS